MKKILLSIFALVLVAVIGLNTEAKAETKDLTPLDSPENYIFYLQKLNLEEQLNSSTKESSISYTKENLKNFIALPKEKQKRFLEILKDVELLKAIYSGDFEKIPKDLRNDIYWTEDADIKVVSPKSSDVGIFASSRSVTHTGKLQVLGVSLTGYKITGKYEYNSKGATKALEVDPVVDYNYNPSVDTGLTSSRCYISNNEYVGKGTFYYKVGIKGVGGIQLGNAYITVAGNHKGKTWGQFYTE